MTCLAKPNASSATKTYGMLGDVVPSRGTDSGIFSEFELICSQNEQFVKIPDSEHFPYEPIST
jgi:hypothetical protein